MKRKTERKKFYEEASLVIRSYSYLNQFAEKLTGYLILIVGQEYLLSILIQKISACFSIS